jgi:hypothetical protein
MDIGDIPVKREFEKLIIATNPEDWHQMTAERVWVKRVGANQFKVENNPLYAYGISFGDIVDAYHSGGQLHFERVKKAGGHSNYRILLCRGIDPAIFRSRFKRLHLIGCRYESSRDPEDVFAIDVPPDSNVKLVYQLLLQGEREGLWRLDEGNFKHAPPSS